MTPPDNSSNPAGFDEYAATYEAALAQGLSASGEDSAYFARERIAWLARRLHQLTERGLWAGTPTVLLDFGCGTGSAAPFLRGTLHPATLVGVDVSARSLAVARQRHGGPGVHFCLPSEYPPTAQVDLAYCNGVFHHIPPNERAAALEFVHGCLRPGGVFALWENNPWNLGTRFVMSRIPFDRDAVTLAPPAARRLVQASGFELLGTDFLFVFPRALHRLRVWEPGLSRLPLGAQYLTLCRRK